MIRTPFESVDHVSQHEQESLGYPRDKRPTPRNIPRTQGQPRRAHRIRRRCEPQTGLPSLATTLGVEIARRASVAAAPPGPGQHEFRIARRRPDKLSEQMTDFRNGQGKEGSDPGGRISSSRDLDRKRQGSGRSGLSTDSCQEGLRQHHQGDMPIPAHEATDLVVIQPHVFARFAHLLQYASVRLWL